MNSALRCSFALAAALVALACGHRRLPPGTPPPEYERPVVSPWPPASASAEAAPVPVEPNAEPRAPESPALEPTPPDAGPPVDAGEPALLDGGSPEAG
jgi:hypothetical protein